MGTFLFLPISGFFFAVAPFVPVLPAWPPAGAAPSGRNGFQCFCRVFTVCRSFFQLLCQSFDLRGLRFTAVELLTLFYEDNDFILGFLPNGCKADLVLYFIFENELRLLDPLIQPADILPHSVAGVSFFSEVRSSCIDRKSKAPVGR